MQPAPDPLDIMRKRLNWRANHRGIKEMDLLVGGFANQRLSLMTESELLNFAEIVEIPDQDLLSWVTAQTEIPAALQSPLLFEMLKFRPPL